MIRYIFACLLGLLLTPGLAHAQSRQTQNLDGRGKESFEADLAPGGSLELDVPSSGVTIRGIQDGKLRIHASSRHDGELRDLRYRFKSSQGKAELRITGGPSSNLRIEIEIPQQTDLRFRMFAGQLDLYDVVGNKDAEISAGQINIRMGTPEDYRRVECSVYSGEIQARPFHVEKGGLFRSFSKHGSGKLTLLAHVGAGQITLE
jgi:hypothetical protein